MQQSARKTIYICLALVSLAVFCIGLVELAVCRVADPILYRQITEPVKQLTVETSRNVKHLVITGRDNLVEMHQNFFEEVSLAAENLSRQVSQIAEAVEEAQLPPDDTELPPVPLAGDPNITSLIEQDGVYYLTGSSLQVVYFNQKDEPWASQLYGTDPIAGYACGPTALAMVVSTFRDEQVDPAQMSKFCADSGYWAKRQGSYLSIVPGVADAYSLTCSPVSLHDLSKENGAPGQRRNGNRPDEQRPLHQQRPFHCVARRHSGRPNSGGRPCQFGAHAHPLGFGSHFG